MVNNKLFSINMKSVKKNTEYNTTTDIVVITLLFFFYLGSIMSLAFYEEMNIDVSDLFNNFKVFVVLCVIMLISITLKYSIGLGLIMTLVIILMWVFRKEITNKFINLNFMKKFFPKKQKLCKSVNIDINTTITEEEFRLVYEILNCEFDFPTDVGHKCMLLGIGNDKKYNKKLMTRYHPDLLKKKLPNLTYEEIDFVSKGIGGCINFQNDN